MMSQDEDLSKMVSSQLTISNQTRDAGSSTQVTSLAIPKMSTKLHDVFCRPRAVCVLAVDTSVEVILGDDAMNKAPPAPKNSINMGIPGFPDFPDSWIDDEASASWTTFCRVPSKADAVKRKQRAEDIQQAHQAMVLKRLRRQAVNVVGLKAPRIKTGSSKSSNHPNKPAKAHKVDRRKKNVWLVQHRRQMVSLRKGLNGLSCK